VDGASSVICKKNKNKGGPASVRRFGWLWTAPAKEAGEDNDKSTYVCGAVGYALVEARLERGEGGGETQRPEQKPGRKKKKKKKSKPADRPHLTLGDDRQ
jgi:hypothetical protein